MEPLCTVVESVTTATRMKVAAAATDAPGSEAGEVLTRPLSSV